MEPRLNRKSRTIFIQAFKVMIGSSTAMWIATSLNLQFAASAGIITLLTILTTKLETLRLSCYRIVTYFVSVIFAWIFFNTISSTWVAYGLYIFCVIFLAEWVGWKATISVNAVIGTHLLSTLDFSTSFIINEFLLVVIGIAMAIILNLFMHNSGLEKNIVHNMKYTEATLQNVLENISKYLRGIPLEHSVWADTVQLEKYLQEFLKQAYEYQDNTFLAQADYFVHYFEMRTLQCTILHNLHYEVKKIRQIPEQAMIIADYIDYLKKHVVEINDPSEQIERLEKVLIQMETQNLPTSREEFVGRAKLYHILMDLEEFLIVKKRFVDSMKASEHYKKDYHNINA